MPLLEEFESRGGKFTVFGLVLSPTKSSRKKPAPIDLDTLGKRSILTILEAAEELRVSDATIERLIASGALQSVKIRGARRITRAAIEAYVNRSVAVVEITPPRPSLKPYRPRPRGRNIS